MTINTDILGKDAEKQALNFLQKQGLTLLTANFRCKSGEIDLIMRDHDTVVFVEVRMRNHTRFGSGAETVTKWKQQKIIRTALMYMQQYPMVAHQACRFDVISLKGSPEETSQCQWVKDAFQA